MKYYFVEFDDSFSNNILCELHEFEILPEIIHWTALSNKYIVNSINCDSKIILGPGPGSPKDYQSIFKAIDYFIGNNFKLIGICLGHQIICTRLGMTCDYAKEIKHGENENIAIDQFWKEAFCLDEDIISVQRYNSLAIKDNLSDYKKLIHNEEVIAIKEENLFSMQFHPESIGTKNRAELFKAIVSL